MNRILKKAGTVFLVLAVIGLAGNMLGCSDRGRPEGSNETETVSSAAVSTDDVQTDSEADTSSENEQSSDPSSVQTDSAPQTDVPVKSQRDGFDEATNQIYEYEGFAFSIPNYMTASRGDNGVIFKFNGEPDDAVYFYLQKIEASITAEDFENSKPEMINKIAENLKISWQNTASMTIGGYPGIMGASEYASPEEHSEADAYCWHDIDNNAIFACHYVEFRKSSYTYSNDIKKIIASVSYTGNGISGGESTDSEATASEENGTADPDVPAGVSPEFKEQMDTYEAFFDEYIEFMQNYSESDDPISLMGEYLDFMQKYTEYMAALDAIDESQLSDADALYFAEVNLRIEQKLLNVASSMYQ